MVKTSLQFYVWFARFPLDVASSLCLCWNIPAALARLFLLKNTLVISDALVFSHTWGKM